MVVNTVLYVFLLMIIGILPVMGQQKHSETGDYMVAAEAGTLGAGLQLGIRFSPEWELRLRGAAWNYLQDKQWQGAPAFLEIEGNNVGLLLDYYPGGEGRSFYLTAGLLLSPAKISTGALYQQQAYGGGEFTLGGDVYSLQPNHDAGNLSAHAEWNHIQPYIGIGWRGHLTENSPQIQCGLDIGLAYMGSARIRVEQSGNFICKDRFNMYHDASTEQLERSLRREIDDFFDIAEKLHVYPVVQFSLRYAF